MLGKTISHYKVLEKIGEGGMGEVYRATDTKLNRDVALKILPQQFASDTQRMARFQREAEVLASLDHPNIGQIYGIEEAGQTKALVLQLIEGPTLADKIAQGPIPVEDALKIALQMAEGLEAAHEKGVIHRDLKPANIKITPEGQVKILDFGLAKALEGETPPDSSLSQSPTLTAAATQAGVILGTAAYMSPEQAKGKAVDKRTDIFAFGAVLYECLTGKRAFEGEDVSDTLASILAREPDWEVMPQSTPWRIRELLGDCLQKDSHDRPHDISHARIQIKKTLTEPTADSPVGVTSTGLTPFWRKAIPWGLAALFGVLAASVVFWFAGPTPSSVPNTPPVSRTTLSLPDGQRQPRLMWAPLAISPDGTLLAYVARDRTGSHLFLRPLDSFESRKIPGSEYAAAPFFSPDGSWIGFFAAGKLKKASVDRGLPLNLANVSGAFGVSWGRDDTIVFAPGVNAGLWRVSADGGPPEQLTQPDFGENGYAHVWPQHLPDGRHLLFSLWGTGMTPRVLDLETGRTNVARAGIPGGDMYLSSGHLAYADSLGSGSFLAAPFDLQELAVNGSAIPVLDDVRHLGAMSARPFMAISQTGTAAYVTHKIGEATLMWVDRDGDMTPVRSSEAVFAGVRLSPDGDMAVFHDEQGGLWSLDIKRNSVDILTNRDTFWAYGPTWHPDGKRVTVSSNKAGSWDLYEIDVAERGEPRALLIRDFDQLDSSWSGNGQLLAYHEMHPQTGSDIWVLPRDDEPVPVLQTGANETAPAFSPDGRFLAYVSDESGRLQVYLRSYPEGEVLGVSIDGGEEPVWSSDGRELFFRQGDQLLAVTLTTEPELAVSAPAVLFEMPFDRSFDFVAYYDVSPDGQRFLVVSERPTTEFKVIQNWFSELEQLVPTGNSR